MITIGWVIIFLTLTFSEDLITAVLFCLGLALILGVIS